VSSSVCKYSVMNEQARSLKECYELGKKLGHGSFGVVHVAQGKECQRTCVVKIVDTNADDHFQGLDHEIKIHSVLDHPNVVKLYETFRDQAELHIVMEMCHGGELAEHVEDKEDPCSEQEARHIFGQVVKAVRYLHCQGFAHRDIKLDNFTVKESGLGLSECTIKLIDFGFTKPFTPGTKSLRTMIGTPVYMAPEIFSNRAYDERCDLWSCGILLFVLLSRRWPFRSENLYELKELLCTPITFPAKHWANRSQRVRLLISGICRKKATDRLTALEILESDWLRAVEEDRSSGVNVLTADMLRNTHEMEAMSRLQREGFLRIAYYSEDSRIAALRDAFLQLDTDADGKVTRQELCQAFGASCATPRDLPAHLFQGHEGDGSSTLGYTEFVAEVMDKTVSARTCRAAFRSLDRDMNGSISVDDLQLALQQGRGDAIGRDFLSKLLAEFDTNHDGEIDFEEFSAMLNSASPRILAAAHAGA